MRALARSVSKFASNMSQAAAEGLANRPAKSKLLAMLDARMGGVEEEDSGVIARYQPLKSSSSTNYVRSTPHQEPESSSVPQPTKRLKLTSDSNAHSKQPSRTQSTTSSSSTTSISKPASKKVGGTKVQVKYPLFSFRDKTLSSPSLPPKLRYIRDIMDANDALLHLDTSNGLGFDLEWKVVLKSNAPQRPTAVCQVCDRSTILVLQLSAMGGKCPVQLKAVLEDSNIPKMGVNILNDGIRLATDFGFRPQGLVELGGLARQADPGPRGYLEKYFRVTNPDYVEEYLESLEKENVAEGAESNPCKDGTNYASPAATKSTTEGVEEGKVPRKPGMMIALATITSMYTQRILDKGPVRSSNWEKEPLTETQREYAANDAYCALLVYERLMTLAKENSIDLLAEKYTFGVKYVPKRTGLMGTSSRKQSTESGGASSSSSKQKPVSKSALSSRTSSTEGQGQYVDLYADEAAMIQDSTGRGADTGAVGAPSDSSKSSSVTSTTERAPVASVKQRPQHIRAYDLWYGKQMALDEMCKTLRSHDNPLKVGTVIGYVVGALRADPSLLFDYEKIELLLKAENASAERHKDWFESLTTAENVHVNMTNGS